MHKARGTLRKQNIHDDVNQKVRVKLYQAQVRTKMNQNFVTTNHANSFRLLQLNNFEPTLKLLNPDSF